MGSLDGPDAYTNTNTFVTLVANVYGWPVENEEPLLNLQ